MEVLICSFARDGLSLGSQARLGGADSYDHVAIRLRDVRAHRHRAWRSAGIDRTFSMEAYG